MALQANIQSEKVGRLPLREGIIVPADTTVRSAIDNMRQRQLGCAIVVDAANKPLGVFSERTVIDLLLHQPDQLDRLTVGQHLDETWFRVQDTDPIVTVLDLVQNQGARFVCVTDAQGQVVGLTGQKGLAEYIADHFPRQVMIQRVGGRPGQETREGA